MPTTEETTAASNELQQASVTDPSSLVTAAGVANIANPNKATISEGTGQVTGATPTISGPDSTDASLTDTALVTPAVSTVTDAVSATQGDVSVDAQVAAAQADPTQMSQLDLEAAQLAQSQVIAPAVARSIESGELISGSAVDMAAVNSALQAEAAQADPTVDATVRGQMSELMLDFNSSSPPAWASGALRNATAQMAARGLGASSMAGQALVQAAMESALPIAMADASTFAKFESQNLSNRQQTAMFAAEQRSNFLGMKFTQDFQSRVANAAKISDIANMNFNAEQQVALENAKMAQTVDLANLGAKNAKLMADVASMSQMDLTNLNNRQQASVINAQSFLAMDMTNLDLMQQTEMFKAQSNINALFSDQAASNASAQFNASSENQTKQFFANMQLQVEQYNSGVQIDREQFNATNSLVVRQANAQWRQNMAVLDAGAQNEANQQEAAAINGLTANMVDTIWQRERDIMDYAFRQSESGADRALSIFLADKAENFDQLARDDAEDSARAYSLTKLLFGW